MKLYKKELNRVVRRSAGRTRDYLDAEDPDLLVGSGGGVSKRYRRVVAADRDCVGVDKRSGR